MITLIVYKKWLERQWSDFQIVRYTDTVWFIFLIEILIEWILLAVLLSWIGIL